MPTTSKYVQERIDYQITPYGPKSATQNVVHGREFKSEPVTGGFKTFPDGSTFRLSTAYVHTKSEIVPQYGQDYRGQWHYNHNPANPLINGYIRTSPGGWAIYQLLNSSSWARLSAAGISTFDNSAPFLQEGAAAEAKTRALNDLADAKANVGENLATFRQTVDLLHNPLSKVVDVVKAAAKYRDALIRSGDVKASWLRQLFRLSERALMGKNPPKELAQRYLEYVYGAKPLLQDIYGLVELAQQYGNSPLLIRGRGAGHRPTVVPQYTFTDISQGAVSLVGPLKAERTTRCTLWAQVDPEYQGTRALNQLGLLNPASLAWELVPFSFVIDWVLPIGPVLQALTARAGLKFVDGSLAQKTAISGPFESHNVNMDADAETRGNATGLLRYQGYSRTVIRDWPSPDLWLSVDPLASDRSWKALALAIGNLKSVR